MLIVRFLFLLGLAYGSLMIGVDNRLAEAISSGYGGKYKFLTVLGSIATTCTLLWSVWSHITGKGKKVKAALLAFSIPVECFITIMYWFLYFYDQNLLRSPGSNHTITFPLLNDLSLHLFPFIALWTELLFFTDHFEPSVSHSLLSGSFAIMYFIWINHIYQVSQKWVYGLMHVLTPMQRLSFLGITLMFSFIFYGFSCWMYKKTRNSVFFKVTQRKMMKNEAQDKFIFSVKKIH